MRFINKRKWLQQPRASKLPNKPRKTNTNWLCLEQEAKGNNRNAPKNRFLQSIIPTDITKAQRKNGS